jgi:ubiquitin-conjugating enzyme E2 O
MGKAVKSIPASENGDVDQDQDLEQDQEQETMMTGNADSVTDTPMAEECGLKGPEGGFQMIESVPESHKFKLSVLQPYNPKKFFSRVKKELSILQSSLPPDIVVKSFEDRMDLFSVLIKGPKATPYEGGLFLFDLQLPPAYPQVPPAAHYISYCSDRLNPNLYESGKVCVSLLGTWSGKGTEVWSEASSNLLQLLVSIQGLILVPEPYFNEAGYLRQKGTALGNENSRLYNEMVVVKLVQSMTKMLISPPESFQTEIRSHLLNSSTEFVARLEEWIQLSEDWNSRCSGQGPNPVSPTNPVSPGLVLPSNGVGGGGGGGGGGVGLPDFDRMQPLLYPRVVLPDFPLLPASQGFCLSLKKALKSFKDLLNSLHV